MEFRKSSISKAIDIGFPFLLIGFLIFMIVFGRLQVTTLRNDHSSIYLDIIEVGFISKCPAEDASFNNPGIQLAYYINSIENKMVFMYDSNMELIAPVSNGNYQLNFETTHIALAEMISNYDEGNMQKIIDGMDQDIHFRWINSDSGDRYLIICMMYVNIFGLTILFTVAHILIILLIVYIVKQFFFDQDIYMKIFYNRQEALIQDFKYRKYNDKL